MKGRLGIVAALIGAVALLAGSYDLFFYRPDHRAELPEPPSESLVVAATSGGVEVAGSDGLWHPARPGSLLNPNDRVRTDDEGAVELRAVDGSSIKLRPATQAHVAELRRELKRIELGQGMVEADVRDDPQRVFEVTVDDAGGTAGTGGIAGTSGSIRTRGAAFVATANGAGTAAIAAERGEVIVAARGKEVVIHTGQYARITPGAPPEAPRPIPASLFLKVDWPPAISTRRRLTVSGQTAPGARVQVGGHYVQVASDGRYQTELNVADGEHRLTVRAVDVGGQHAVEESPRIVVDTRTDFNVHPPKWK